MISTSRIFSYRTLLYHLLGWVVFFIVHYIFFSSYEVKIDTWFLLLFWFSNIAVFYLNFLVLVPYLLFGKRFVYFILSVLALVLFFYFSQTSITDRLRENRRMEIVSRFKGQPVPPSQGPELFPGSGNNHPPMPPKHRVDIMVLYNILLFFMASTAVKVMGKLEKEEKLKRDAETHKALEELKLLKQQVNPHFLFNSLNSIYSLANQKSELTTEAVLKLSATLRYMLYDVNEPVVFLKNEIENIRNFIELQKFRLTDDTVISLIITGDLDKYLIEPLLLIPFVENAFKFGADNRQKSYIHIEAHVENGDLKFNLKNKIVNRTPNGDHEKSGGIGLSNVKRRLEILYPDKHTLELISENDIFEVKLFVKLRK